MKKVAVFCGSCIGFSEVYKNDAIKLGNYFVENKIGLVYGGGKIGMMGVIADTIIAKKVLDNLNPLTVVTMQQFFGFLFLSSVLLFFIFFVFLIWLIGMYKVQLEI